MAATRYTSEEAGTTTEAASPPAPVAEPVAPKTKKYVKYNGLGTRRVLSEADWERVSAKGQDAVEWNFSNNFKIPVSEFSTDALRYFNIDDNFEIVEIAEDE